MTTAMTERPRRRSHGPDGVGLLIADLGRAGVPTAAEARAHHARMRGDDPADAAAARAEFAARNVPLLVRIAAGYWRKYYGGRDPHRLMDLVSAGGPAYLRAVDVFDPARGRFSTVAARFVRPALRRHVEEDRLVAALAVLGSPLKALHLDAAVVAVAALAELRGEDGVVIAVELLRVRDEIQELKDIVVELRELVGPPGDGR